MKNNLRKRIGKIKRIIPYVMRQIFDTPCQKIREGDHPLKGCCCCNCVMHIPLVKDFFKRETQKGWLCIAFLIASKGNLMDDDKDVFIEECGEHGICELYMYQPLKSFFKGEKNG